PGIPDCATESGTFICGCFAGSSGVLGARVVVGLQRQSCFTDFVLCDAQAATASETLGRDARFQRAAVGGSLDVSAGHCRAAGFTGSVDRLARVRWNLSGCA